MGEIVGAFGSVFKFLGKVMRGAATICRHPGWGVANAVRFRYRDYLWPLVILAILGFARVLVSGADSLQVLLACLLASGVITFYLRRKLDRVQEWVYAGCCLGGATVGLFATSLIGTDSHLLNAGWIIVGFGLAAIWWSHHGVRGVPAMSASDLVNSWNTHIRDGKGRLAGAEIRPPIPFEHGDSHTGRLVPYKQTIAMAQADLPNISSGLDIPLENLILEPHPDYPKRPTMFRLQHITRSPIEQTVWFDQPRCEEGRILLGPYADGIGEAYLRFYEDEQSMWSTTLTGGTGIGKSRLIETIAINALGMRDSGQHTVIFYMDGQNGASSPVLFEHATWSVGVDGALRMLSALERIASWRNKENRAHQPKPLTGFAPSAGRPGIFVIIDEAHLFLVLASFAGRLANLAKSVRKLGISFLVAAHDYGLGTMKDDTLRAALLAGNGLVMNVSSRITGNLIPGLGIDPNDLPKIPGYGVVVGAAGSGIRTAPFRGRYAPDDAEKERSLRRGEKVTVRTIEEWFERYPALELDPKAARAAGDDYRDRHETAEREREELLKVINADDDLDLELAELVETEMVTNLDLAPETGGATCAQRIRALDWANLGEVQVAEVMTYMPEITMSAARKALDKLAIEEGFLIKDASQPRRVVYRRAEK